MARLPRFSPIGILQHVIQRGNNRTVCFADGKVSSDPTYLPLIYHLFRAISVVGLLENITTAVQNCAVAIEAAPAIAFAIVTTGLMTALTSLILVAMPLFAIFSGLAFGLLLGPAVNYLSNYSCNNLPD